MTQPSFLFRLRQSIRTGYQLHGVGFPFVGLQRLCVSFWRRTFRKSFLFSGEQRQYWIHPYILNNERAVEVSLAHTFLRKPTAATLEVGNVLANFFSFPHDVVDKYEKAPGVLNEDIVSYSPGKKYDFIVTLSTLEHVGWD